MTKEEMFSFIQKLKKDYPKFPVLTDEEFQVWKDILSKITLELANVKYEDYKNSPDGNTVPSVDLFMINKNDESSSRKYLRRCSECGKLLYHDAMNLHEDRHRSINYINKMLEKHFNKSLTKEKMEELLLMKNNDFDKKYNDFLRNLVSKTEGYERNLILMVIYSENNQCKRMPSTIELEKHFAHLLGVNNDNR